MMLNLLRKRRSIRKFEDKKLEPWQIEELVKAALMAPSSRTRRPWEFIVVEDPELLNKLALCKEHSASFLAGAPRGLWPPIQANVMFGWKTHPYAPCSCTCRLRLWAWVHVGYR